MSRVLITMNHLDLSAALLLLFVQNIWTTGPDAHCNDQQMRINGHCCDMCPPGTYLEDFCSNVHQTICRPCEAGHYSDNYTVFSICEKCPSCQQEYTKKCTPTTSGTCSCRSGFLCSNNICSVCVENKCTVGDKLKKTETPSGPRLTTYSYECEPKCPGNQYFDAEEDICKQWTQCSDFGLAERFPGNKTHNVVCDRPGNDQGFICVILGVNIALLILVVFLFCTCSKNLRTFTANTKPIQVTLAKTSDSRLSEEESGHRVISQDKFLDSNISGELHLEEVSILS